MSEKRKSPCGAVCAECEKYPNDCKGCEAIQGKVWWTKFLNKTVCDFYDCCVNGKKYNDCGECADFPCEIFKRGDPTKSEEENLAILKIQIENLKG